MFKVVNNKIYMTKGETPTYTAVCIDRDTGTPFMIGTNVENPLVCFTVSSNIYGNRENIAFRAYLDYSSYPRFDKLSEEPWEPGVPPSEGEKDKLHRRTVDGVSEYAYWIDDTSITEGGEWIIYEFGISLPIPYEVSKKFDAKTYKYEICLLGGNLKDGRTSVIDIIGENAELPIDVNYKRMLLDSHDFIVEGSSSE